MANSQSNASSSTQTNEKRYEVFLSFRGTDTRDGFTNNLYEALRAKSIATFMDEPRLEKGGEIWPTLLKNIRASIISVIIFSKDYASSKWCLRELVEIMGCREKNAQTVIPVFYNVAVSDVRYQEGSFKVGFDQLKNKFYDKLAKEHVDPADFDKDEKEFLEEMQKWRKALKDASRVKGWNSYVTRPESKLVDEIVKDILVKLKAHELSPYDVEGLVGSGNHLSSLNHYFLQLRNTSEWRAFKLSLVSVCLLKLVLCILFLFVFFGMFSLAWRMISSQI